MRELNLLLSAFPQCDPQRMTAEFVRECDLIAGIVIEVYRNWSQNEICFEDVNGRSLAK
jgi:hypothetical protein